MTPKTLKGAGPFYYDGNQIGILFLHGGGGGTCADLKDLAEDLRKNGYTINIPLLPGFGTTPEDLKNTSMNAWKKAAAEELDTLKNKCKKVFVGGHSMGGILTLLMASKYEIDGLFTISAPIGIRNPLAKLVPFFKIFVKYHKVEWEKLQEESDGKWVGYKKIPLNILSKINKLMKEMKESLKKVKCPALLMQGRSDSVIKADSMEKIYAQISSQNKKKVWLAKNEHSVLLCEDHKKIVSEITNFINGISN